MHILLCWGFLLDHSLFDDLYVITTGNSSGCEILEKDLVTLKGLEYGERLGYTDLELRRKRGIKLNYIRYLED